MATKPTAAPKKPTAQTTQPDAPKKPGTAVAAPKKTALSTAIDFGADAGGGMEGAGVESFAIPFLTMLQKMSPQCDPDDPKFIKDAKPGMLFNSVTQKMYDGDEGVIFIPCAYQRRFIRWAPKGSGASFKGEILPEDAAVMMSDGTVVEYEGRWYFPLPDGTVSEKKCDRISDTRNHFGLLLDPEDGPMQVLLSLASTQIKKSKAMMSLLSNIRVGGKVPPTWLNKVRLTKVSESNDKGTWSGYIVKLEGFIEDDETYAMGKAFHQAVVGGTVQATYEAPLASGDDDGEKF